jgi:hypothetical protein
MADQSSVRQLVQFQPRGAFNKTIQAVIQADNVPQFFPSLRIPYGLVPVLRARSGNSESVFAAIKIGELTAGRGREIVTGGAAGSAINFPVDNLGQICIMGKTGDVLTAEISGAPIG